MKLGCKDFPDIESQEFCFFHSNDCSSCIVMICYLWKFRTYLYAYELILFILYIYYILYIYIIYMLLSLYYLYYIYTGCLKKKTEF